MPSKPKVPSKTKAPRATFGLSHKDARTLRALNTPVKIQRFLDALTYQYADTAWSPHRALRERKGHCLEGALLAATALRLNGHPPLVMDLEGVRDDDHVIALYRERGLWGGVAKSNFAGLRFRAPIYRTLANSPSATSSTTTTSAANAPCAPTRSPSILPALTPGTG